MLLGGYGAYRTAAAERQHLEQMARADARDVAFMIERELASKTAMLQALAISASLQRGDLEGFYHRAREFMAFQGINVVVRDLAGRQLVNTRVPWGTPLPQGADISATDQKTIATGLPQVTGLFMGAVAHAPMYMIEMPAARNGKVTYLVGLSVPAARLQELVTSATLGEGRRAALIDGNSVFLARTVNAEAMVGKRAIPAASEAIAKAMPENTAVLTSVEGERIFAAFHRIGGSDWAAAVAVPEDLLLAPVLIRLKWLAAFAAMTIIVSTSLALVYSRFIRRQTAILTASAAALGKGHLMQWSPSGIREMDDVGEAMATAGRELRLRWDETGKLLAALSKLPVIVRALDGRITFWGDGATALYGFEPPEALGKISHQLLATDFPIPLAQIVEETLFDGRWKGVLRQRTKAGDQLLVHSAWALWRDTFTGQPAAVVETNSDMTARAAQTVAEEASRDKTAFLGAISHDLRQPFQALRLFHQVLATQAGADTTPVIERMGQALTSAEEMLSAMSDLSVMESGVLEQKPSLFSLGEVLAEIAEDCSAMAASAHLRLRYVPTGIAVHTDRVLFKRMLRNLVVNAIRYTRRGGVLIGCRRRKGMAVVQVVDTGIGIPEAKLANVFEAFYQVGDEPQNGTRGLGLGLAIVSRLSHLLRLPVSVTSLRDRGSVFGIEIAVASDGTPSDHHTAGTLLAEDHPAD
ncbi:MAG: sensor histidine kinase [Solirubrobacterales bacterium]